MKCPVPRYLLYLLRCNYAVPHIARRRKTYISPAGRAESAHRSHYHGVDARRSAARCAVIEKRYSPVSSHRFYRAGLKSASEFLARNCRGESPTTILFTIAGLHRDCLPRRAYRRFLDPVSVSAKATRRRTLGNRVAPFTGVSRLALSFLRR